MNDNDYESVVSDAIHELRYFNQRLKNLSEELTKKVSISSINKGRQLNLKPEYADEVRLLSESILDVSQLITTRLDFIDCEINPSVVENLPISDFNIFGKVDKARRMLNAIAREKKVKVIIDNNGGEKFRNIQARSIIDILPYLIIDNAVKYSPRESEVNVVFEEYADCIKLRVFSIGPYVSKDEIPLIINKSYRSINARKINEITGRGLGLYFAKHICDMHDIDLRFHSENLGLMIEDVPYGKFLVELTIKNSY
ncbi:HAMP domain-containing histidine kinase [Dickeya dadantii]|uniref:sensor histidine kinase n=1 Tax=Dickeya dadantii TaxID=204038 RepID=UPI0013728D4E|nr:HAMP domain-containing sensor histidine kinase [Dickeya dadantii]MCL6404624.1 HAMP domain-containing histidine kinase [Dickeya dadantii]NAT79254.1 hypothetical protein [Dickeya dadantii]NPE62394.1 sensor histidine kinase [Dickeya dadantii]